MFIYIIMIIISVFFAFVADKSKKAYIKTNEKKYNVFGKIMMLLSMLFPLVISAFRNYSVGSDTGGTYYSIYNAILYYPNTVVRDYGFKLLTKISILLFSNYTGLLITTSSLFCICSFSAIYKESKNIPFCVYLFYAMNVFFISMNMIRESITISLFLLSISYLKEKKFLKYLIINLIGTSIHTSGFIYIVFYFIYHYVKIDIRKIVYAIIIFLLFDTLIVKYLIRMLSKIKYFNSYFSWYLTSKYNSGEFSYISFFISLAIILLLLFLAKKHNNKDDYKISLLFSTLSLLVLSLSSSLPLMQRTSWLFSFPLYIYLPNVIESVENTKLKLGIKTGVIILYTLYMVMLIFIKHYHEVVPYVSIFGGN